jgi:hypothetical protein
MTQQHPIIPPPELIEDWIEIAKPEPWKRPSDPNVLCTLAAQWGADQELEACVAWLDGFDREGWAAEQLRDARRPEPPSLKEQALQALDLLKVDASTHGLGFDSSAIRRALESMPD